MLLTSASPVGLAVADLAGEFPDVQLYQALGLELVDPSGAIEFGFESLSRELVDTYPADVVLLDRRASALGAVG